MGDQTASSGIPPLPERFRFAPEFWLLVACSWLAPPPLERLQGERIGALCDGGIDWDRFVGLVDRHRVPALAYTALGRHGRGKVPEEAWERLRERNERSRREALRLAAETIRLAKRFAGEGIDVLPLKGGALSQRLFRDPGMRQTRDIDLMVRPVDLDRADRLLAAEGYRCTFPGPGLSARQRASFMGVHHDASYVHDRSGVLLELHCRYMLWTPEQVDSLWSLCREEEWLNTRVLSLDQEAQLLFLCDHGACHAWFRAKWLGDVAVMLAREPLPDWEVLLETAARLDLNRVLAQSALLAHWLFGLPLHPRLAALIEVEKTAVPLACEAIAAMLTSEADLERSFEGVKSARYLLRLRSRPQYGKVLMPLLICQEDITTFPLPGSLLWLYVPLRLLFWLRRHCLKK